MSAPSSQRSRLLGRLAVPLVLVAAAAWTWGFVLALDFTGADAWPILHQADRATRDPGLLLRERYLAGVWDGGTFWRPVFVALHAAPWALFGDDATPHHALRLLAHVALALAAGSIARRAGGARWLGALVAGAVLLLHPVLAHTVPSVARGADVDHDLALVLTIALLTRRPLRGWSLALGVLAALSAPGIKETGLLAPVLGVLALAPWQRGRDRSRRRVAGAVLLAGLGAHLALRWSILGSLGHYESVPARPLGLGEHVSILLRGLAAVERDEVGLVVVLGLLVPCAVALGRGRLPRRGRRAALPVLVWLGVLLAGDLLTPRFTERHVVNLLGPLAVLGGSAAGLLAGRRSSGPPALARAALLAVLLGALGAMLGPRSPATHAYPQWQVVSRTPRALVEACEARIAEARATGAPSSGTFGDSELRVRVLPDRTTVRVEPFPFAAKPPEPAPGVGALRQAMLLLPYGLRAALLLRGHTGEVEVLSTPVAPI